MSKKNVHILPNNEGWSVKTEGAEKAFRNTKTKKEAVQIGRGLAKNNKSELVIHNKDGKISDKDSFGNDPASIKDRVH